MAISALGAVGALDSSKKSEKFEVQMTKQACTPYCVQAVGSLVKYQLSRCPVAKVERFFVLQKAWLSNGGLPF